MNRQILSQPQLNLNWVGFDTKMGLHTTPPHHHPIHPNSTSITRSLKSSFDVTYNNINIKDNDNDNKNNNNNKQNNLKTIGLWPHRN